jgi:phospholipase/carboxylesterase
MKQIKKLDFDFIESKKTKKVIIALHGWQGNKDSFLPLVKNSLFNECSWFLLQGPYSVDNDPNRRTWSYELELNNWAYEEPKEIIYNFFQNEVFKKFESKNIYVIGFSLGALVCYEYICSMNQPLGGIFPISGFMKSNNINLNPNQIETPIIIGHGKNDTVVPLEKSMEAYEVLKRKKANVELVTYDAQHNIPIKMLTIISKTIKNKP